MSTPRIQSRTRSWKTLLMTMDGIDVQRSVSRLSTRGSIAGGESPKSPSPSTRERNPYRRSIVLCYFLEGQARRISGDAFRYYEATFRKLSADTLYISDDAAMKILDLSGLSEDDLCAIWDNALEAKCEFRSPTPLKDEHLCREDFFVLMAELQRRLGIKDEVFQTRILSIANENLQRRSHSVAGQNTPDRTEVNIERITTRLAEHSSECIKLETTQSTITGKGPNEAEAHAPGKENSQRQLPLPSSPRRHQAVRIEESAHQATENRPLKFFPPPWTCPVCTLDNPASCLACSACGSKSIEQDKIIASKDKFASKESADTLPTLDGTRLPAPNLTTSVVKKHITMYSDEKQVVQLPSPPIKHLDGKETVREPSRTIPNHAKKDNVSSENKKRLPDDLQQKEVVEGPAQSTTLEKTMPTITPESTRIAKSMVMDIQKRTRPRPEGRFNLGKWKDNREKTQGGFVYDSLATVLKKASKEGNLQLVASILALGADVNYSSPREKIRHYAFIDAYEADHQHVSDYLLSKGTDKLSVAKALRNAILRGQIEKAKKLVPHAELTQKSWSGIHPFNERVNIYYEACCVTFAIAMKHPNRLELFRLMINDPSFLNANSLIGKIVVRSIIPGSPQTAGAASPLAQFASTIICDLTIQGDLDGIKAFLERYGPRYKVTDNAPSLPDCPVVDPLGCIPIATWREDPARAIEIAELLIRHGADAASPFARRIGCKAIVAPVMARCLRGVQFLLARGADPDGSMVNYCFPETAQTGAYSVLGYAASVGETEICQALVEKGAIPWKADSLGDTPLIDACRRGHLKTAQYLLTVDNGRSDMQKCLDASVKANNLELVRSFIDSKAFPKSSTWLAAMRDVRPDLRPANLAIIDLLVSLAPAAAIDPEIVLTAIDNRNFVGISRLLELRGGKLGFDVNATFENRRWPRTEPLNCIGYAEKQNAISFVVLLKSYGWHGSETSMTQLQERCSAIKSPPEVRYMTSALPPLPPGSYTPKAYTPMAPY